MSSPKKCMARTKRGTPCKNFATRAGRCGIHQKLFGIASSRMARSPKKFEKELARLPPILKDEVEYQQILRMTKRGRDDFLLKSIYNNNIKLAKIALQMGARPRILIHTRSISDEMERLLFRAGGTTRGGYLIEF